jgi:hypothetical protein
VLFLGLFLPSASGVLVTATSQSTLEDHQLENPMGR